MGSNPGEVLEGNEVAKDEFVSKKAYVEVKNDMMTYKNEMKNLKAELEKFRADKQALDEQELVKKGEYQKVADEYKQKFMESEAKRKSEMDHVINLQKLHKLENELGGFQKSEYAKVAANLGAIKIDENGIIDDATLKLEAQRIKQEHPSLLRNISKQSLPNQAAGEQPRPADLEGQIKGCKTIKELEALQASTNKF